jgi:hypothetical protein
MFGMKRNFWGPLVLLGVVSPLAEARGDTRVAVLDTLAATLKVRLEVRQAVAKSLDDLEVAMVPPEDLTMNDEACGEPYCLMTLAVRSHATHILLVQGSSNPAGYHFALDLRDGKTGQSLDRDDKNCELCSEDQLAPTLGERFGRLWMRSVGARAAANLSESKVTSTSEPGRASTPVAFPKLVGAPRVSKGESGNLERSAEHSDVRLPVQGGLALSEAAQIRIPRVDGVPNAFSNVVGLGFLLRVRHIIEFAPQARLIYSFTTASVSNNGVDESASARGVGWELGLRFAMGWFSEGRSGVYFYGYPAFSSWSLHGNFSNGSTFSADINEFSTEAGAGYKLSLDGKWGLDFFASAFHLGFRPQEREIVSVTSYPAIGAALDCLCF